jgi:two-component SAPR family response regulator
VTQPKASERILVLEDDESLREILCEALRDEAYSVCPAASAQQAIQSAEESGFDIIVADIRMAGVDGIQAVEAVRLGQPQIRIILMTGYSSEADSVRALHLGIHEYLRKPFQAEDLILAVERQVRHLRQEARILAMQRAARGLAIWSLENQLGRGARGVAHQTYQVALHLGLSGEQAAECQVLALAELLRQSGTEPDFELLADGLGTGLRSWLHQLDDDEPTLTAAVAQQAVRRHLGDQGTDPSHPVTKAFEDVLSGHLASQAEGKSLRRSGSLLALAQGFETSNPSEAIPIYEKLAKENQPTQACLEAHLGLVRLEREDYLAATLQLARQMGPLPYAESSLQLGLLVRGEEGLKLLASAARIFGQIPGSLGLCLARLAHYALESRSADEGFFSLLQQLMTPHHSPELHRTGRWLLPYLLQQLHQRPRPELGQACLKLLRSGGNRAWSWLSLSTPQERQALLQALPQSQGSHWLSVWQASESDEQIKRTLAQLSPGEPPTSPAHPLRLYTLGPIQLVFGEELLPDSAWSNRKQLLLLVYLAAFSGAHPEDVIIDRLWPDKDPIKGRNNINSALSHIRKVLKQNGADPALIQRDKRGVWFHHELPHWHDLHEFESLIKTAKSESEPTRRLHLLGQAAALYRGNFLDGHYFDWAEPQRQYLENLRVECLLKASELALETQSHLEALEHAHRLLELDPCCQQACGFAMQAYLALGRWEESVRIFERTRKSLHEDLGMEPSIALLELNQRALMSLYAE